MLSQLFKIVITTEEPSLKVPSFVVSNRKIHVIQMSKHCFMGSIQTEIVFLRIDTTMKAYFYKLTSLQQCVHIRNLQVGISKRILSSRV